MKLIITMHGEMVDAPREGVSQGEEPRWFNSINCLENRYTWRRGGPNPSA